MSEYQFPCPHCAEGVVVDESYAGHEIACPVCAGQVICPDPAEAEASEIPGGEACPNCGAGLEAGAVICMGCGYNTQTGAVMGAAEEPSKKQKKKKSKSAGKGTPSMLPGYLGAVGGGLVAMGCLIGFIVVTESIWAWAAWLAGGLVGFVARVAAPRCSTGLGIVAAISAFLAITLGQGIAGYMIFQKEYQIYAEEAYEARVAVAQESSAVFKGSGDDAQIRKVVLLYADWVMEHEPYDLTEALENLTKAPDGEASGEDGELDWYIIEADEVTDGHIKEFKEKIAPELQRFLDGDPSKEAYIEQMDKEYRSGEPTGIMLVISVIGANLYFLNILFLALGVGSAFKLGAVDEPEG